MKKKKFSSHPLAPVQRKRLALEVAALSFLALVIFGGYGPQGILRRATAAACVNNPVVTSLADSGPGSLREAIAEACPGSTITFAVTGTITLTTGEMDINENLTIQGPGANLLTINGNNTALHVFNVRAFSPAVEVMLSGLSITGGNASGISPDNSGAGINFNNSGTLVVSNCVISGNNASGFGGQGGGIFQGFGTLTVTDCTIASNKASSGGGICVYDHATVTGSTITGNSCPFFGGGILQFGFLTITNSTISSNSGAAGGGLDNNGVGMITDCTFTGNTSGEGGGIENPGSATIVNTTISSNTGMRDGGGGIFNIGDVSITNCTISNNNAPGASSFGGGGIFNFGFGVPTFKNTIVALNSASNGPDVGGQFTSQGHNLIGMGDGSTGFTNGVNGDQAGTLASPINPKLGPLQNNGGPTQTLALLPGSPAIDAGDDAVLGPPLNLTTDQRGTGFLRKGGAHVDIGAFEVQPFDTCLRDDSSGNLLQWNSTTGRFTFTNCSNGKVLTGVGTVSVVNGLRILTVITASLRIGAGFNPGQRTGAATIYVIPAPGISQVFRINDTNPFAVCACGGS